jgi:hypothetical protein
VAASVTLIGWTVLVRAHPPRFFPWATLCCLGWVLLSWKALGPEGPPRMRARPADVLWGLALGAVLYGGAQAVLRAGCGGLSDVLCAPLAVVPERFGAGSPLALVAIALVIVPAEELFWRGAVQQALRPRLGWLWAVGVSAVLSSLVLLVAGEWLLALAALPTSLAWGLLAEWRRSLVASWVSHALWTPLIAVSLPVG